LSTACSIFSQVLKLIPRTVFDSAVHKHAAERNAKGFSSWGQLVAMLFCQLGSVNSLRDITNGLAAGGGPAMLTAARAALEGVDDPPELLAVTLLTSMDAVQMKAAEAILHEMAEAL